MARRPRVIGKGVCHHVYAWGNDRHPVFKAEGHYKEYLEYLEIYSNRFDIDVLCFALMAWHVHLSLFDQAAKLPQFMRGLHGRYAQYYNGVTGRVGHVFGERYNNRIVQTDQDNIWLSRYIHRQAVEAGIVKDPADYRWTSYRAYAGLTKTSFLRPKIILNQFGQGASVYRRYADFVKGEDDGPIDWSEFPNSASEDGKAEEKFAEPLVIPSEECLSDEDLLRAVAERLDVSPGILLGPRGRRERELRHEAFSILVRGFGFSASRTSRLFGVTPKTVCRAVWR